MKKIYIKPYKMGSKSAKLLAKALNCKRIKGIDSKFIPKPNKLVIQWGNPTNKLEQLKAYEQAGVPHPPFTTAKEKAQEWLSNPKLGDGIGVLARTSLTASQGLGIIGLYKGSEIPEAPLYVKYIPKQYEYRVHVFNGKVIDITQKRKKQGVPNEEVNYQIRNHHNGWVYCREDLHIPTGLEASAIQAVQCLGLLFGAVDVIWNKKQDKCYVLETNSAPGLEGTTVVKYVNAIKELANV